jgi:hypothetical protein
MYLLANIPFLLANFSHKQQMEGSCEFIMFFRPQHRVSNSPVHHSMEGPHITSSKNNQEKPGISGFSSFSTGKTTGKTPPGP